MAETSQHLKIKEIAELFGVDRSTVFRWIDKGYLAAEKLPSGFHRVSRGEVDRLREQLRGKTRVYRVMAIDDEPPVLEVLERALERSTLPIEFRGAIDPVAALLEIGSFAPDAIILDYRLSNSLDGLTIAEKLKESPATAGIPVILISGILEAQEIPSEAVAAFVSKPFKPAELCRTVEDILQGSPELVV